MTAAEWNAAHKPGIGVLVKLDDGKLWHTKTRSAAAISLTVSKYRGTNVEQRCTEADPLSLGQAVKTGLDGRLYCVFPSGAELLLYLERDPNKRYSGKRIYCAGGYENAICLED